MTEWKLGWKVVCQHTRDGRLYSAIAGHGMYADLKSVVYKEGRVTKRPKSSGPLGVFDSIERAREWRFRCGYGFRVYRCGYLESKDTHLWSRDRSRHSLPPGTVLADEVTLLGWMDPHG